MPSDAKDGAGTFEEWFKSQPFCIDYPDCDGCLPGRVHSAKCPMKTPGCYSDVTFKDAFRAGAELMRERAAQAVESKHNISHYTRDHFIEAIRALPIEPEGQ